MRIIFKNKRTTVKILLDIFFILFSGALASFLIYDSLHKENRIIVFVYLIIFFFVSLIEKGVAVSWSYTDTRDVLNLVFMNIISAVITGIFSFLKVFKLIRRITGNNIKLCRGDLI